MLWDCGLGKGVVDEVYLCPTSGKKLAKSVRGRMYNEKIRRVRMIVEQSYSRIKRKFPCFMLWRRKLDSIADSWYVAVAITNIDIMHGHPLRHVCDEDCAMCICID